MGLSAGILSEDGDLSKVLYVYNLYVDVFDIMWFFKLIIAEGWWER